MTPGVVYALDRSTFRMVLMAGTKQTLDISRRLLKRVHLLEGLTDSQITKIVSKSDGEIVAKRAV